MKHLFLLAIALSFLLCGCNSSKIDHECDDCPGACTYEFTYLTINIKDSDGNPVELVDYNVTIQKTDEKLNITFKNSTEGTYAIASDNQMSKFACEGTKLDFNYSLDGVKYKTESFLVGKDCCHIKWRDVKAQEIIIN